MTSGWPEGRAAASLSVGVTGDAGSSVSDIGKPDGMIARVAATLEVALGGVPLASRVVAVSGGRDSMVLLQLLARLHRARGGPPPRVIHIHHGLVPAADDWAAAVRAACAALDCECRVRRVRVERAGDGPEAAAREARMNAFEALLGDDEHLLTAHHRDDQAETVLLRLLRGAGPRGLAGMRPTRRLGRGWLTRPLLMVEQAALATAAAELGLRWQEDPSNQDRALDRNYLRHEILPRLAARWPAAARSIERSARACSDQQALLDEALPGVVGGERAEASAEGARRGSGGTPLGGTPPGGTPLGGNPPLHCAALVADPRLAHAALRRWLASLGVAMPTRVRLDELLRQLRVARPDARIRIDLGSVVVQRYRGALHAVPKDRPSPSGRRQLSSPGTFDLGAGRLSLRTVIGAGLRADRGSLSVCFRSGGERLRPTGRGGSVALKQWLQEQGVPPWERDRLPLVYCGDALVAVADLHVCDGWRATGELPGWQLRWIPLLMRDQRPSDAASRSP